MKKITVLGKGYVRLVDVMGSDLSVVNAARVSFAKESQSLTAQDVRLIMYLARNGHTSPFRHAFVTLEVKAPLFVARQWWKYIVGSDHVMDGWNEVSRRYVTEEPEFYIPGDLSWRSAPEDKKQGSGPPVTIATGMEMRSLLEKHAAGGSHLYKHALESGICPEQARLFLPAYAMFTTWRWSASLQSVAHFLAQRLEDDAQLEIQMYAKAVKSLVVPLFPVSIPALVRFGGDLGGSQVENEGEEAGDQSG